MSIKVSDLVWTYNHCYKQRCFYNPYPHGSATWTGNGPTGTRNCGSYPWHCGRGGYNYRHELITCSPNFQWCKLLKTVCEWNHEEGRLVKRTSPVFHCDADWAALSNAGYIIYDESAHTWYSTSQGRALNNLIKEAFAELERAEQEAKEKQEQEKQEETQKGSQETTSVPCGAPEGSVVNPISNGGVVENQKKSHTKIKTFTFEISCFAGSADFGTDGMSSFNSSFEAKKDSLTTSEEIDKIVNEFTAKVDVVSVSVDHHTLYRHNNAGFDTIITTITIVYND